MTKTRILIIYLLGLLSCQSEVNHNSSETLVKSNAKLIEPNNEFTEFYDKLPEVKLPYNIICGINPSDKIKWVEYTNIPNFIAIGKFYQSKESKIRSIIGYYQTEIRYPYLFTFDNLGIKIDSIAIHNGNCVTDPWIEENCWAVIDSNNEIMMTDTTKYFFFGDTMRRLDSTIVLREKITIDFSNGSLSKKLLK